MSLVRNEQTKLTATWLNGMSVAAVAVGVIAPVTAALIGTTSSTIACVAGVIWLTTASALHLEVCGILRSLRALSAEVDTGSAKESASRQRLGAEHDCNAIGHVSSD